MNNLSTTFDIAQKNKVSSKIINDGFILANQFINRSYLANINNNQVLPLEDDLKSTYNIRLYKITKIVYDPSEDINDKLTSVYNSVSNINASCAIIINSTINGIEFYIGTRANEGVSTAGKILEKGFIGNFCGSDISNLKNKDIEILMDNITTSHMINTGKSIAAVSVVPSIRDENKENFIQGIEKFINAMQGELFTAILLAEPISKTSLIERKKGYEELYSVLSPFSNTNYTYGENYSDSITEGISSNFTKSINNSISNTQGGSSSSGRSISYSNSYGSDGFSTGRTKGSNYSNGINWSKSITEGNSISDTSGTNSSDTKTKGTNTSFSIEYENKSILSMLDKINQQLERIKYCESFGIWECASYFIADDMQTSVLAANTFKALVTGNESGVEDSFINIWGDNEKDTSTEILNYLKYLLHPEFKLQVSNNYLPQIVKPTSLVSGSELPILMGLPRKSINGVTTIDIAEFGRNIFKDESNINNDYIDIGNIFNMGLTENEKVQLNVQSLSMHCFITGSTGSGKSNTSYKLLHELIKKNIKFLVIEPAKGEYKTVFGGMDGVNVFGTNPKFSKLLRINPFKFNEEIHILEHLDRLIEIFNASWPMFGSMPAILKDAIERTYMDKGWDLKNSINIRRNNNKYPNFKDLLRVLPEVINQSNYSQEAKGNYIGALVTRVNSLTNGLLGQIFSEDDLEDEILFDENCIVDISRIGSTETKSLIMGILFLKLQEHRMATSEGENIPLKHVTLIEEAHNLLRRSSFDQNQEGANLLGKSVELISNGIAEMRTYGEGFIIIDQSPSVLDQSVIRNTNTKIVMRLPDEQDRQSVGMSFGLNEHQIKELSKLKTGVACIHQSNWLEAVLCKVSKFDEASPLQYKPLSRSEEIKYKGEIIKLIFKCYTNEEDIIDKNIIFEYVDKDLEINKKHKNRIKNIINNPNYAKEMTLMEISELLDKILDCNEIFNINKLDILFRENKYIKVEEDKEKISTWYKNISKDLDYYIDLSDSKIKEWYRKVILKRLIYLKTLSKQEQLYYKTIYNIIFK